MKTKRPCPTCQKDFLQKHGNQLYCSPVCKEYQKAATQQKLYGILKEFRKGYLGNYKLFEQLLPKSGSKTLLLSQLNADGFKPNCFYGAFINDKKETFYKIAEYQYRIYVDNQVQHIKLIKP